MKNGKWVRVTGLTFAVSMLYFCSANPVGPEMKSDMFLEKGIPRDQIAWVGWNQEIISMPEEAQTGELARRNQGFESKKIYRNRGGEVGGRKTFMNRVEVPEFAFEEAKLTVSVRVLYFNAQGQNAAGVEFLPSRHYNADMQITLSWGFLDIDGDAWEDLNLQPYYSEDNGVTWFPVETYVVDPEEMTITFGIDHFTQYGWGLADDDDC